MQKLTMPFPLRYSLPFLLLVLGGALALMMISSGIYVENRRIENDAQEQLRSFGEGAVARIEYFSTNQFNGFELWQEALANHQPYMMISAVYDDSNHLLGQYDSPRNNIDTNHFPAAWREIPELVITAQEHNVETIRLSKDRNQLRGAFPFVVSAGKEAIHKGVVYTVMNLRPQKDAEFVANFQHAVAICVGTLLLMLLSWVCLNRILTRRVAILIAATRDISGGNLSCRAMLAGRDELAELALAFNQMAEQMQSRTLALSESEERHRRIVETAYEGIFALDAGHRLTFVNRRFAQMLGTTIDVLSGCLWRELLFDEDWQDYEKRIASRQFSETSRHERRLRSRDGGETWTILSFTISRDTDGNFTGAFGMATDITERKRAEATLLLQSEALTACANAVVIADADATIEWVNPAFMNLTGFSDSEAVGQKLKAFWSDQQSTEIYMQVVETLQQGQIWKGELASQHRNSKDYIVNMTIAPVSGENNQILHYVAILEDVTEKRAMEFKLQQSQKMEAVSQLAGGLAHEFNNLLTVIVGYARLLKSSLRLNDDDNRMVSEIVDAGKKAGDLTRRLLLFSRRQPLQPQPLDLQEFLTAMAASLVEFFGPQTVVQCHCENVPEIEVDTDTIRQAIEQLAANARDVMPDGGRFCLTARLIQFACPEKERPPEALADSYVCLSVSDTGKGMKPLQLRHIFEPFFTTNATGKHEGLGLATVYSIVKQHKGWIEVVSQEGHGTTFKLFFPVYLKPTTTGFSAAISSYSASSGASKGTILLVEDDVGVRKITNAFLRRVGFDVLEAFNAASAVGIWQLHAGSIDLLFTDMILPGEINGDELARRFLLQRPDLKILFSSGYSREFVEQGDTQLISDNYLTKPFDPELMIATIRQILER